MYFRSNSKNHYICIRIDKGRLTDYMEPPSSILTDGKSKADPRSDDPLSCDMIHNHSFTIPGRIKAAGIFFLFEYLNLWHYI